MFHAVLHIVWFFAFCKLVFAGEMKCMFCQTVRYTCNDVDRPTLLTSHPVLPRIYV